MIYDLLITLDNLRSSIRVNISTLKLPAYHPGNRHSAQYAVACGGHGPLFSPIAVWAGGELLTEVTGRYNVLHGCKIEPAGQTE
jgi:hypothetical protein